MPGPGDVEGVAVELVVGAVVVARRLAAQAVVVEGQRDVGAGRHRERSVGGRPGHEHPGAAEVDVRLSAGGRAPGGRQPERERGRGERPSYPHVGECGRPGHARVTIGARAAVGGCP